MARKRGCLWSILRFFLKIFLLIIIVILGLNGYKYYNEVKTGKELKEYVEGLTDKYSTEDFKNLIKDEDMELDFDNDGLSNSKEIELNLDPYNSDTDNDGITDGAEVLVYNSNPIKYSTADDDVSDGAKAIAKLNPLEKIKDKNVLRTAVDEETGVKLETNDIESFAKYIITEYKVTDKKIKKGMLTKPYIINNFKGDIFLELKDYNNDSDITVGYFNYINNCIEKVDEYQIEDNIIKINIDENKNFPVVAVTDNWLIENNVSQISLADLGDRYLVFVLDATANDPVSNLILKAFDIPKKEVSQMFIFQKKKLLTKNNLTEEEIRSVYGVPEDFSVYYYESHSGMYKIQKTFIEEGIKFIHKVGEYAPQMINKIAYMKEYNNKDGEKIDPSQFLSIKNNEDELIEPKAVIIEDENNLYGKIYDVSTSFNVNKHGYSFGNFGYPPALGGNCAGFAYTTMRNFNNNTIPEKFTYKPVVNEGEPDVEFSYNISDDYYTPLLTRDLINYKMADDTREKLNLDDFEAINERDTNVLKMLGTYWRYANDKKVSVDGTINLFFVFNEAHNKEIIEKMVSSFKEDKIVYMTLGWYINNGNINLLDDFSGHAVNAYKLKTNNNNPNIIDVTIYDNNFPQNQWVSQGLDMSDRVKVRVILERKKILGIEGLTEETVSKYIYAYNQPYEEDPYNYKDTGGWDNLFGNMYVKRSFNVYNENDFK